MRKISLAGFILLFSAIALAQAAQPPLEPKYQDLPEFTPPVITFTLNWPDAKPPFFSIAIESEGRIAYQSTPEPSRVGIPYVKKFVASDATRTRIFEFAKQLNFFQGRYDYKKGHIAYTGTKTLTFDNGKQETRTSYNWSDNPQIQQLTVLFQNISATIELGRSLEEKYQYDKLGVDQILKDMEEAAKRNELAELQSIQPILNRIATDQSVMNIARRRAMFLLSKIPPGAAVTPTPTSGQH